VLRLFHFILLLTVFCMKTICLLTLLMAMTVQASAQRKDSVVLGEVQVYGLPMSRYSAGTKVLQLQGENESGFMNKIVGDETTSYFKNYGNNQLSTIAFRGTSASQTAVLWNGININSPTLGQTDFTLLPVFLMEDIAVQYGTASSQYGSDALGGSIILGQARPHFSNDFNLQVQQQTGSFGKNFTGVKSTYGSGKVEFRSKAYTFFIQNDFPFHSPAVGSTRNQNNASVSNYGFDQQMHVNLSSHETLSAEGMYTHNFRNIQPTVTNDSPAGTLKDDNARLAINYRNDLKSGTLFATGGWVQSNEVYDRTSTTKTGQFNLLCNVDMSLSATSNIRFGINAAKYMAWSDNFAGQLSENRYDGFFSYRKLITSSWNISLNLRQSVYASHQAPFAPSVGSELKILQRPKNKVLLRVQASRGYRVPTLNDRYWIPGGNPSVKPEDARHVESGLWWSFDDGHRKIVTDLTGFDTWTKQWILWLPESNGIWSPTNLQKVNAYGLEASASYGVKGNVISWQVGAHYGLTKSINQAGLNAGDFTTPGKQLPYIPVHLINTFAKLTVKSWTFQTTWNYTSLRYTTLDNAPNESLPAYVLFNAGISRNLDFRKLKFIIRGDANNILNIYYENVQSLAMPGRNYAITLIANL
jgi:vitamin B12 transporter